MNYEGGVRGTRVTLWSRYATTFTNRLPRIAEAVHSLAAESGISRCRFSTLLYLASPLLVLRSLRRFRRILIPVRSPLRYP